MADSSSPIPLLAIVSALHRVLPAEHPADTVLSHFFRTHPKLGASDRHHIAETVFATLRRLSYLRALIAPYDTPRAFAIAALIKLRGVPIRAIEHDLGRDEKEWVVTLKGSHPELTLSEQAELPPWAVTSLQGSGMSDEAILALGRGMQRPAPLDLRVNTIKAKREDVLAQLEREGIAAEATPYSPFGIRLKDKIALNKHSLFAGGKVEVQDEGSQLLGLLLAPKRGEMVTDFCAGAGGKTLLLGAMMQSSGRLYAFDVAEGRLSKMKPRLARSGLSNVHPQRIEHERDSRISRLVNKMDRVLVDAPCSGLGTLRRNPDLKLRQNAESVAELNTLQRNILQSASRLVRVGGRLVYATCSILPAENQEIVRAFLADNPQFSLLPANELLAAQRVELTMPDEYLNLTAHQHGTDGFFAAALVRHDY